MANWYVVCFDKVFTEARKEIDGRKVIRIYEINTQYSHADAITLADRMDERKSRYGISHVRATPNKPYYSPKTHYISGEVVDDIKKIFNY